MCEYGPIPACLGIAGKIVSKSMKYSGYSRIESSLDNSSLNHGRPVFTAAQTLCCSSESEKSDGMFGISEILASANVAAFFALRFGSVLM
jgi:hypothetical protein